MKQILKADLHFFFYLTLIAILKQLEQLHACLNIKMVEHCVRTTFDAEQLQSTSTFCAEGELSADSSVLAWARMPSSCLFLRHHVKQLAATMRTSRSLALKEEGRTFKYRQMPKNQRCSLLSHLLGVYLRSDLSSAQLTTKTSQSQRSCW